MEQGVDAVRFDCDACGDSVLMEDGEGPPMGWYSGDVTFASDQGDIATGWDACRPTHIRQAVQNALDRKMS
jgi:hypothetical protein